MSEPRSAPTVLQMVLGKRLQDLRERAGLTPVQVAAQLRNSPTSVRRMERAEVALKYPFVEKMLEIYGIAPPERQEFLKLAEEANRPGWWQGYRDVLPDWFSVYVSLESSAAQIRTYEPHFIPGLLQTADYARAVLRLGFPRESRPELDRRVALRMERQSLLISPTAPSLWVIMDETVLRRPAGGRATMLDQVDHLLGASDLSSITLQLALFESGPHPGAFGPFTLFRFQVPELPDVVYQENLTGASYVDDRADAAAYRETLDRMSAQALSHQRTRDFLGRVRKEL